MAGLAATKLQNLRVASPLFDKNMSRPKVFGALDFFAQQTNSETSILSPELRSRVLGSIGRTVQIPVFKYDGNVTVSSSRSCTISTDGLESALYGVTFATYSVGFTMIPALHQNNEIGYDQTFARKLNNAARALANALDQAAVTALSSNKTKVFGDALYYDTTGNVVNAPYAAREDLIGDLNAIMMSNDYNGQLHIIGNAGIEATLRKLAQSGLYNAENKQLQYADKVLHFTNNVANGDGQFGTLYAVEDGNVGMLTRVDREAFRGARANGHEWDIVNLPYLGSIPVGSHYYESVGSVASDTGEEDMVCNVKEFFGFSVDVAFVVAYNSDADTIASPIIKAQIAAGSNVFATPVVVEGGSINATIANTEAIAVEVANTDAIDVAIANTDSIAVEVANTTSNPVNTKEVPAE